MHLNALRFPAAVAQCGSFHKANNQDDGFKNPDNTAICVNVFGLYPGAAAKNESCRYLGSRQTGHQFISVMADAGQDGQ